MGKQLLSLAHEIRNLLAKNLVQEALTNLHGGLKDHNALDEVIQHSARYESIRNGLNHQADELATIQKNRIRLDLLDLVREIEKEGRAQTRVFISYSQRGPGGELAGQFRKDLQKQGFIPFLDTEDIHTGADWAETILNEIQLADYFVLLLSPEANTSEMVLKEVLEARKLKDRYGKPLILPVRVCWPDSHALNFKLNGWLNRIQYLNWSDPIDSNEVIKKLMEVISNRASLNLPSTSQKRDISVPTNDSDGPPSPVAPLEVPRGAVRLESQYYIVREHEDDFIERVKDPGALLRIRGPRQFGKTSLLARVMAQADALDYTVVGIDFQDISEQTLADLESLVYEFCYYIAEELDLEEELDQVWTKKRDPKQLARTFVKRHVLNLVDKPILLALDEADRLFSYRSVSTDFFLMLRAWHEKSKSAPIWEKLKMALSYSTEAKLAIADLNASPFNVGEEARIIPFSDGQVADLATKHGIRLQAQQIDRLLALVGGQPYLVRRALYLISKGEYDFESLTEQATQDRGPFSDHLRHHLVNIKQFPDVCQAFKEIMQEGKCKDPLLAGRLTAAGLVKGTPPNQLAPANGLYHAYFKNKL